MSEIKINTSSLNKCGMDIVKLSNELNEEFNLLFKELANIEKNEIWMGTAATEFVRRANIEKIEYTNFVNKISTYGKTLSSIANSYENATKKIGG